MPPIRRQYMVAAHGNVQKSDVLFGSMPFSVEIDVRIDSGYPLS